MDLRRFRSLALIRDLIIRFHIEGNMEQRDDLEQVNPFSKFL